MSKHIEAIIVAGATLGSAIAELVATSSAIQAVIFGNMAENHIDVMDDEMFLKMHQQLQPIHTAAGQLIDLIKSDDILTSKAIEMSKIGIKSRTIVDVSAWTEAKSLIETKGFVKYLEDLQVRNSRLDRTIDDTAKQLDSWLKLSRENQVSSISDDDGIIPAIATLGANVTWLHSYATAGMLLVQQLTATIDVNANELIDA